jgi:hypothetical protein
MQTQLTDYAELVTDVKSVSQIDKRPCGLRQDLLDIDGGIHRNECHREAFFRPFLHWLGI